MSDRGEVLPELKQSLLTLPSPETATFDHFAEDAGSRIKEILTHQIMTRDQRLRFIWIWGQSGSGRTHLLQAACRLADQEGWRCVFLPLGQLDSPAILDGLAQVDLVCMDDLDRVIGKRDWAEAIFHLLNDLTDQGHQLMVSSLKPPVAVETDLPDLKTRLMAALPLETPRLSDAIRLKLLRQRARSRGLSLSDEAAQFILHRSRREMDVLMRGLDYLDEESMRQQRPMTIPFIKKILKI